MSPEEQLWWEAEAAVQCDLDEDVRAEAQGLAIAEMADVHLSERWEAFQLGVRLAVLVRGGRRYEGELVRAGSDFVFLRRSSDYLIPAAAIVGVFAAPRVLHTEAAASVAPTSWRSVLRDRLGESVQVITDRWELNGLLTWVGHDHVTLARRIGDERETDLSIAWSHVDVIAVQRT